MIRFNLSLLLTERNLKITKVSHDTGISRTTLTYLYYNYAKGIQLDTLNLLCQYLKVTPDQLISYIPIDIEISETDIEQLNVNVPVLIRKKNETFQGSLELYAHFKGETIEPEDEGGGHLADCLEVWMGLPEDDSPETKKNNEIVLQAFNRLPITFFKDIESRIFRIIEDRWLNDSSVIVKDIEIYWDNGLDFHV